MYDIKNVIIAESAENACTILSNLPSSRIISGGTDLLIQIREGKIGDCELISIHDIKELKKIYLDRNGDIYIGAGASFSDLLNSDLIVEKVGVLVDAANQVAGPQIQSMGTVGGNVCNGITSADLASGLFALDAKIEIMGAKPYDARENAHNFYKKIMPIAEFYTKPGVNLSHGEIVTNIIIPKKSYGGYFGSYYKYAMRNAMDIATVGCSVISKLSEDKKILVDVKIAFGVMAPVPIRCPNTEKVAAGRKIEEKEQRKKLYDDIKESLSSEMSPRTSWRASKEFRTHIGKEIAIRALMQSIKNGGGEADV